MLKRRLQGIKCDAMSFIKVLMVAEKPSIAEVLARSLSGGRSFKGDSRIPLHEYRASFLGQDAAFSVTSVMGHVFRCAIERLFLEKKRYD